jgi:LETM1 and EF-hand domain-containing protein 1, mitochondrial
MEKAKMGETLPNDAVLRFARMFKDELTLGNISRPQLVTMCQFMGLVPYGSDAFLRFQVTSPGKPLSPLVIDELAPSEVESNH